MRIYVQRWRFILFLNRVYIVLIDQIFVLIRKFSKPLSYDFNALLKNILLNDSHIEAEIQISPIF